jgi:HlyD family type I secretion membrane fusion protein
MPDLAPLTVRPQRLPGRFFAEPQSEDPRAEIRLGVAAAGVLVATVLAAGLLIPLDAAVVAPGVVKVAGDRQKLQSAVDGSVAALSVNEGDRVRAGDVLVRLASVNAEAPERSLATRVFGLEAEIARLEAEQLGAPDLTPPTAFAHLLPDDRAVADRAITMERAQLRATRANSASEEAILEQQIGQVRQQMRGAEERRRSLAQQRVLLTRELDGIRDLASKGFASKNRVLQLERNDADLAGSVGQMAAEDARLRVSSGQTRLQIDQQRADRREKNAARLRDARTELASLMPQWQAAQSELARTSLRAPVSGTVVGLAVHTVGGFVQRGQTLLEVVPRDRSLEIEAHLDAADGNAVHEGDRASLRFPGLHGRNVPELHGTVRTISADSLSDERTGRSYYSMAVRIPPDELARLRGEIGEAVPLRPGNPVTVSVSVRSRSALGYWLEPLFQSLRGAMHER